MNRKTHPESLRRSRGVTLIEILLVISALVIVLTLIMAVAIFNMVPP